jgi:DNA-binding GntR family transcriptional regulator
MALVTSPLTIRAHARIIEMILSGVLNPGDALQEAKLGELLDMSRTPVREAIKRIEAEGLAVQEGRFFRVRRLLPDEVEEIFFLRQVLEVQGARAAVTLPQADIERMEDRVQALMQAGPGEGEEQRLVDDDFHVLLAGSTGNRTLVRMVSDLRLRTCMFDVHQVPERFLKGCEEHLAILGALRSGDADLAGQLMSAHIGVARNAILARLQKYSERDHR